MPDETKIVTLEDQIRKNDTVERVFGAGFLFGLGIAMLGFFLFYDPPPSLSPLVFLYWGFAGLALMLMFLLLYGVSIREKNGKIKHLEELGYKIPKCSKCEHEVPRADSDVCPFCGETLKSEVS